VPLTAAVGQEVEKWASLPTEAARTHLLPAARRAGVGALSPAPGGDTALAVSASSGGVAVASDNVSIVPPHIQQQLQDAVVPREAEIIRARQVLVEVLTDSGRVAKDDLINAAIRDGGGQPGAGRNGHIELFSVIRDEAPLDPDHPVIKTQRLRLAAMEALAAMAGDGDVTPVARPGGAGDVQLPVSNTAPGGGGTSGSTFVIADQHLLDEAYRLSRRMLTTPDLGEIVASLDADPLGDLLGARGVRCFHEAVLAFRRGLYLAAANLAAAASEAAWYGLGELVVKAGGTGTALRNALDNDNTAKVIQLVTQHLQATAGLKTTMTELQAQAIHLRDLRNYAVHPRGHDDQQREAHFTEPGCLSLLMLTRRNLERLSGVAHNAGLI